jgi:hypothetical protein
MIHGLSPPLDHREDMLCIYADLHIDMSSFNKNNIRKRYWPIDRDQHDMIGLKEKLK